MITIVKFRAFDKPQEKNFYEGETMFQIHKSLSEICSTYVPIDVIIAHEQGGVYTKQSYINYLKKHQQTENEYTAKPSI